MALLAQGLDTASPPPGEAGKILIPVLVFPNETVSPAGITIADQ
jgi:hypothetical protein